MQETWVNVYCNECDEGWETKISELPDSNGEFECNQCENTAHVKEFLRSERDLEVYEEFN